MMSHPHHSQYFHYNALDSTRDQRRLGEECESSLAGAHAHTDTEGRIGGKDKLAVCRSSQQLLCAVTCKISLSMSLFLCLSMSLCLSLSISLFLSLSL